MTVQTQKDKDRIMLLKLARDGGRGAMEALYRDHKYIKLKVGDKVIDLEKEFGGK